MENWEDSFEQLDSSPTLVQRGAPRGALPERSPSSTPGGHVPQPNLAVDGPSSIEIDIAELTEEPSETDESLVGLAPSRNGRGRGVAPPPPPSGSVHPPPSPGEQWHEIPSPPPPPPEAAGAPVAEVAQLPRPAVAAPAVGETADHAELFVGTGETQTRGPSWVLRGVVAVLVVVLMASAVVAAVLFAPTWAPPAEEMVTRVADASTSAIGGLLGNAMMPPKAQPSYLPGGQGGDPAFAQQVAGAVLQQAPSGIAPAPSAPPMVQAQPYPPAGATAPVALAQGPSQGAAPSEQAAGADSRVRADEGRERRGRGDSPSGLAGSSRGDEVSETSRGQEGEGEVEGAHGPAAVGGGQGFLSVLSSPFSRVYVDSRLVGTTPVLRMEVPAGPHVVYLVSSDAPARRTRVVVRPGQLTQVRENLLD